MVLNPVETKQCQVFHMWAQSLFGREKSLENTEVEVHVVRRMSRPSHDLKYLHMHSPCFLNTIKPLDLSMIVYSHVVSPCRVRLQISMTFIIKTTVE